MNSSSPGRVPFQQALFPAFYPAVILPQGGGTFLVKPGKPVERITVKEAARIARCSPATIYRLYEAGHISGERVSVKLIRIYAESLQAHLEKTRDPEFWGA
ncbi:MAG: hypothetical protein ABS95_01740 [Verrucomicrobia bacterium SCN 57-15]|nr:MAG: hypothetical protein ABS95_01740 [Verrucomicrobia bacterium SCN 57-15]